MLFIVTGTINPNSSIYELALKDNKERLNQYVSAIKKLLNCNCINKVIFCENSNFKVDLSEIYDLAKKNEKQFEFIQFKGDDNRAVSQGKGYGEGEIIKYVLHNSRLIKTEEYFFKITGRLFVTNIDKIIKNINKEYNYFNLASIRNSERIDTRFYGVKISDYVQYLQDAYKYVDDKNQIYLENMFYKMVSSNSIKQKNTPLYPRIVGQAGSSGEIYKINPVKLLLKDLACKLGAFSVR